MYLSEDEAPEKQMKNGISPIYTEQLGCRPVGLGCCDGFLSGYLAALVVDHEVLFLGRDHGAQLRDLVADRLLLVLVLLVDNDVDGVAAGRRGLCLAKVESLLVHTNILKAYKISKNL